VTRSAVAKPDQLACFGIAKVKKQFRFNET
jgi:hypothetical protein